MSGTITRPQHEFIETRCADIVYDAATSKALWTLCRGYAALYNAGLEALRNEPALPLQNTTKEGVGLYGRLTEWRSTGRYGADALPVAAARAAFAQAHTAHALWENTQSARAQALLDALDKGTKLPRRVERAEPSMGPRFRTRKKLDRAGTNQVSFITDVKQRSPQCFTLPGGLEVRTTKGLQRRGSVVSAQVMERTPKKFARAGCTPEQRTFALHVQYRVPAPVPGSVTKVRAAPKMRDEHTVHHQAVVASPRFVDRSPAEVVATLLDEGQYLRSQRTMYRILAAEQPVRERRNQLTHPGYTKPELVATAPNQTWSWDITRLLRPTSWTYFHLYVLLDIFSRYVVEWMIAERENAALAAKLIEQTCLKHGVEPQVLTLHSDRGAPMTSKCTAQLPADLGVTRSLGRPQVSDDNPFSEA